MANNLAGIDHELRTIIIDNRHSHFSKKNVKIIIVKISKDELDGKIFKKGVIDTHEAV